MDAKRAEMIGKDLMVHFGLGSWVFEFDRAKVRFGLCQHKARRISVSLPLVELNSEAELIDTVLHEIAHALAGPTAGHGRLWKAMAMALGARPERCYRSEAITKPSRKYVGTCPSCQASVKRHLRKRIACARCCRSKNGGRFSEEFLFAWKQEAL